MIDFDQLPGLFIDWFNHYTPFCTESRRRKARNWEDDDYYDSDEDTFLDRTGTIEKKRIFRMQKSGKESKAETYESLVSMMMQLSWMLMLLWNAEILRYVVVLQHTTTVAMEKNLLTIVCVCVCICVLSIAD